MEVVAVAVQLVEVAVVVAHMVGMVVDHMVVPVEVRVVEEVVVDNMVGMAVDHTEVGVEVLMVEEVVVGQMVAEVVVHLHPVRVYLPLVVY